MFTLKIFVLEAYLIVDRRLASAVTLDEVSPLNHESLDYSVKAASLSWEGRGRVA